MIMFPFTGFPIFHDVGRTFQADFKCFPVSMLPGNERKDVETGGKIIMPSSALDTLTRLNVEYPMLFKLHNKNRSRTSHAGVLEFVADEGKCYLPYWMMNNLLLEEGDVITIESISLPVANFSKFQPQNIDFLDITNPKAVLENALRNFACLTTGDVIAINYNRRVYELLVMETKPGNAVSIIECDMNVEFEAPVGYKEPQRDKRNDVMEEPKEHIMEEIYDPFKGSGNRLDGKKKKDNGDIPILKRILARGVPDYEYQFGSLKFDRTVKAISDRIEEAEVEMEDLDLFRGQGFSMKNRK